ncbi:hypothetical protein [Aliivibrio fischeri]|uniref:hypothetical protein n=1 Tax=Aliivibrio fischeri TaxID=668 RepID=UPI00084C1D16|nr:hypothetical protein [Aliivibrio fischeri]OED56712.1 hypothetical protein BEI47_13325 [Aliivibrio fischeri]
MFELALYPISFLVMLLLMLPHIGLIGVRISIDANMSHAFIKQACKIAPLFICLLLLALQEQEGLSYFLLLVPIALLFLPLVIQVNDSAHLSVEISYFRPHSCKIHLTQIDQDFTRSCAIELLQLIDLLREKNVTKVTLSSPLFLKGKKLRKMSTFLQVLEKKNVHITSTPTTWLRFPFATFMLGLHKYLLRKPTMQSITITHWHTYTLHL